MTKHPTTAHTSARQDRRSEIQAIFFDLGGVILRTEYEAPRDHLADKLGLEYEDLVRAVFRSESCQLASLGRISADEHWRNVTHLLKRPASDLDMIRAEFFAGDVVECQPPR